MTRLRTGMVLALLATAGLLAGCGSTGLLQRSTSTTATTAAAATAQSSASADSVIRDWARALRSGNVRAAARYFSLPSVFANGPTVLAIRHEQQAILANASLSCGAKVLTITQDKNYYHVVFRLTDRPGLGGGCGSGTGAEGATDFVIAHGLIVHWIRAPITEKPTTTPQPAANPQGAGQPV